MNVMAQRFRFVPDWSAQLEETARIREVQFGDGYSQRSTDGLNSILQKWSLQFNSRKTEVEQEITAFFRIHGGVTAFDFVVPGGEWSVQQSGFGIGDGSRTQFLLQRPTLMKKYEGWQGEFPVSSVPRVNYLRQSGAINGSAWTSVLSGYANSPQFSPGALAPDGSSLLDYFFLDFTTNEPGSAWTVWQSIPDGLYGQITVSGWFVSLDGYDHRVNFGAVPGQENVIQIGQEWKRHSITYNSGGSTLYTFCELSFRSELINPVATGMYAAVWGLQVERSGTAGKYVHNPSALYPAQELPDYLPGTSDGFRPVGNWRGPLSINKNGSYQAPTQYVLYPSGLVVFNTPPAAGDVLTFTGEGDTIKRVVAKNWRSSPKGYDSHDISVEFHEVME